jgi:cobalt-zinc-cadmium resistance protein CzcA
VNAALSSVNKALLEAIAFVVVLLVLFLGNLRASLVVALILPLAALFTFIMMRATGMSANLMSLISIMHNLQQVMPLKVGNQMIFLMW